MMTAEQLKNSILQLAMQGKLVEQRFGEGTGEDGENSLKKMIEAGEDVDSGLYEGTYCVGTVSYRHLSLVQSLHVLWEKLSNVSCIFEENAKEAFLPTMFSAIISYETT